MSNPAAAAICHQVADLAANLDLAGTRAAGPRHSYCSYYFTDKVYYCYYYYFQALHLGAPHVLHSTICLLACSFLFADAKGSLIVLSTIGITAAPYDHIFSFGESIKTK